jgi:hypothetical protein
MASMGGNEDWVTAFASACRVNMRDFVILEGSGRAGTAGRNLVLFTGQELNAALMPMSFVSLIPHDDRCPSGRHPADWPCRIASPGEPLGWIA